VVVAVVGDGAAGTAGLWISGCFRTGSLNEVQREGVMMTTLDAVARRKAEASAEELGGGAGPDGQETGSLIAMVRQACREGVESVPDPPPELTAFISAMEAVPDWIDMSMIAEGAREARIAGSFCGTRGAFIATFTNTYAALPMALTGALSGKRATRRVNETANFFTVTTLPGALDRYGPGSRRRRWCG